MKLNDEDGRQMVEYQQKNGRRFYTDAERFVEDEEDFSDRIPDEDLPEELQGKDPVKDLPEQALENIPEHALDQIKGVQGFKKLPEEDKRTYLTERIPSVDS